MGIMLTEKAAREIKHILDSENMSTDTYLRVGVKGGGCSGFTYTLDLTDTKGERDEEFEEHGVKVLCDAKSYLYLDGTTVDFRDEIQGRGFVFNNPNATHSCGCGSSFAT